MFCFECFFLDLLVVFKVGVYFGGKCFVSAKFRIFVWVVVIMESLSLVFVE